MKDYTFGTIGSLSSWLLTIAQTNEIMQLIMFIMSIISTAFTIAFIVYKWYNKAKEDGKVSGEIPAIRRSGHPVERGVPEPAEHQQTAELAETAVQ